MNVSWYSWLCKMGQLWPPFSLEWFGIQVQKVTFWALLQLENMYGTFCSNLIGCCQNVIELKWIYPIAIWSPCYEQCWEEAWGLVTDLCVHQWRPEWSKWYGIKHHSSRSIPVVTLHSCHFTPFQPLLWAVLPTAAFTGVHPFTRIIALHKRIGEMLDVAAMCGVNIVSFQEAWSEWDYRSVLLR